MLTESELIQEATKRGYLNAKVFKPAHLLLHTNCPELEVPEDAKFFYSGGWLYYSVGTNTNFKDTKHSDSSYCALIYHESGGGRCSWAEIVDPRGYTFPPEGVCWKPNNALIQHLKNRPDDTGNSQHVTITKGVAWNRGSYWNVSSSSGKPEYYIEELARHLPHILPEQLSQRPLTPQECYKQEEQLIKKPEENGKQSGSSEPNAGVSIKVQRPNLFIRGREPIRGIGIKCPDIQIKIGSGHLPDSFGLGKG